MDKSVRITRSISRTKLVRKVGLDSSILVALLENEENYSDYKLKIFERKNFVHICQKVFSEAFGVLAFGKKYGSEKTKKKIFSYMRKNNIKLIKKNALKISELNSLLDELKRKREHIQENPEDSDLEIIAMYKLKGIDCIFTVNDRHFRELCKSLDIDVEKPIDDFELKMKNVFGRRKRR